MLYATPLIVLGPVDDLLLMLLLLLNCLITDANEDIFFLTSFVLFLRHCVLLWGPDTFGVFPFDIDFWTRLLPIACDCTMTRVGQTSGDGVIGMNHVVKLRPSIPSLFVLAPSIALYPLSVSSL